MLAPDFSAPKVSWGEGLVGKVTPWPPALPLFTLPVASPASTPVHWLEQRASGSPSTGSKKGIQDMKVKVDETLTHVSQCSPRFVWVCSLVADTFVHWRVPFDRL